MKDQIEYQIVEQNRQIWIERKIGNGSWVEVNESSVPRYHASVELAREWVKTLRKGRVIHSVEDDGLQWFLNRVGKMIRRDEHTFEHTFKVTDTNHARHLHRCSVDRGYVYKDAPNIAQDERKPDDGVKPLEWFLERVGKVVYNTKMRYPLEIHGEDFARFVFHMQKTDDMRYSDHS